MAGGLAVAELEILASVLALTPAGWIIILVGATASIAGELIAKDYIKPDRLVERK